MLGGFMGKLPIDQAEKFLPRF
jgi:hypothetical protein